MQNVRGNLAVHGKGAVLDDFPEIRGPDDIAPALAASRPVLQMELCPSMMPPLRPMFCRILEVLETAHRLGRGLSMVGNDSTGGP
jgi:hypothetical protein